MAYLNDEAAAFRTAREVKFFRDILCMWRDCAAGRGVIRRKIMIVVRRRDLRVSELLYVQGVHEGVKLCWQSLLAQSLVLQWQL